MKKNSWKKGLGVFAVLTVSLLASSSGAFSDSEDITTFDVEGATYGTFPSSINEGGRSRGASSRAERAMGLCETRTAPSGRLMRRAC